MAIYIILLLAQRKSKSFFLFAQLINEILSIAIWF